MHQWYCNTLGVKHALSLIKAMHKHSHQAQHHEQVIHPQNMIYVLYFMCFKYAKNMVLASKIVEYSNQVDLCVRRIKNIFVQFLELWNLYKNSQNEFI